VSTAGIGVAPWHELAFCDTGFLVNEDAALLNRRVTQVTPPHFSTAVYRACRRKKSAAGRAGTKGLKKPCSAPQKP
jgi:hypothetical protein